MGNFTSKIFRHRMIADKVANLLDYLRFYLIFDGGFLFKWFESNYIKAFDKDHRMQRTKGRVIEDEQNCTPDWENPKVVGRRRRLTHTKLRSFFTKAEALNFWKEGDMPSYLSSYQQNILFLTGTPFDPEHSSVWDFHLVGSPNEVPKDWVKNPSSNWDKVSLPGHWQLQGFDVPIYTNTGYPFAFDPPRVRRNGAWLPTMCDVGLGGTKESSGSLSPKELGGENTTGLYRCEFALPSDWLTGLSNGSNRVFLVFEGVDSCLSLWVDGDYVGYSQDSCLPAEFEVTNYLSSHGGLRHTIAVQVSRWCDGSYLEDQDKWWLSGIYREVYLVKKPAIFISDYTFVSDLGPDFANFNVEATVEGFLSAETKFIRESMAVRVELWDSSVDTALSSPVCCTYKNLRTPASDPASMVDERSEGSVGVDSVEKSFDKPPKESLGRVALQGLLDSPKLWSCENPALYILVISLHTSLADAERGVGEIDAESCRVGFREIKISADENLLCINGVPVVVAGVNRNEFDCRRGRFITDEVMRQDAQLLKRLNFNAVRCSHYPSHSRWLEICDEAGLYVIDEANIETHGFQFLGQAVAYLSHHKDWQEAMLSRVTRMYGRDKNATCVIGWSLGNESGVGPAHEAMFDWLHARDPRRFVQYESGGACSAVTDIICPMYMRPYWCKEKAQKDQQKRPVILCEYSHAMGNSAGGLSVYWDNFWIPALSRMQGGFIWDLVDQGLMLPEEITSAFKRSARGAFGYGGDFGDLPNTKQFCINGILGPDRSPHPIAYEAAALQAPVWLELRVTCPCCPIGASSPTVDSDGKSKLRIMQGAAERKDAATAASSDLNNFSSQAGADGLTLCLVVWNRRAFTDLSDLMILVRLQCDAMALEQAESLPFVEFSCASLPPRTAGAWPVLTILQSFAGPSGSFSEEALRSHFNISENALKLSQAVWLDIKVITLHETEWVPKGLELLHSSFSHPSLLSTLLGGLFINKEVDYDHIMDVVNFEPVFTTVETDETQTPIIDVKDKDPVKISPLRNRKKNQAVEVSEVSESKESDESTIAEQDVEKKLSALKISWKDGSSAVVSATCGRVTEWLRPDGSCIICSPIDACVWRAPTDNDRGGDFASYFTRWKAAGYDILEHTNISIETSNAVSTYERILDGSVVVDAYWGLQARGVPDGALLLCSAQYIFSPDGAIEIFSCLSARDSSLPPLPRFGLKFAVPGGREGISHVQYLGLGPFEAYDDRMSSARLGYFQQQVDELHEPYVVPQESGRRADPRWVALRQADGGQGLVVIPRSAMPKNFDDPGSNSDASAAQGCGWSVSRYPLEAFDKANHDYELDSYVDGNLHVHIDCRSMGLGGYDSWSPNVDPQFLILPSPNPMSARFLLVPLEKGQSGSEIYLDCLSGRRGGFGKSEEWEGEGVA